ncbi:MAG: glutamine-hydrolyzing carbamoyl-phosphate synthase small subunit [Dethiobacter sp.]|nr:glutamine-hydrolyzing carbamoyl-phosphate synthase small subunit [Dethiobacter sp.]
MNKALLVLADGTVFEGTNFGASGETIGEVVFNTSMIGYQEILTDPSYKGQIVSMTYTQIGNYGVNGEDVESAGSVKAEGFVVKECLDFPSNWRAGTGGVACRSLGDYLKQQGTVGIERIDTRALTLHLRDYGSQMGIISTVDFHVPSLLEKVRAHPAVAAVDLVEKVSTARPYQWQQDCQPWCKPTGKNKELLKVVVYDLGVKYSLLRHLVADGFAVTVVSANTLAEEVLEMDCDGVLLSNGPGDPATVTYAVENARKLLGKKPLFGVCLGHQILGLAMGGQTYKLKFGHHGGNHPVIDLETGLVEITAQNHNYCVDLGSLRGQVRLTHKNLYDGTEEGMRHVELPVFSVQHHPEAGPGPNDAIHVFRKFREMIGGRA